MLLPAPAVSVSKVAGAGRWEPAFKLAPPSTSSREAAWPLSSPCCQSGQQSVHMGSWLLSWHPTWTSSCGAICSPGWLWFKGHGRRMPPPAELPMLPPPPPHTHTRCCLWHRSRGKRQETSQELAPASCPMCKCIIAVNFSGYTFTKLNAF